MPTEAGAWSAYPARHPAAVRRTLRLALGTALSLWFSQALAWQLSFMAPALTLLILATPLPAPSLKQGLRFIIALIAPTIAGAALVPFLLYARWAGVLLLALALYYSFYYTARGGSQVLGAFMTVGLTVVVTIGAVSPAALVMVVEALAINAVFGMGFVWIAHALLPDQPDPFAPALAKAPPAQAPNLAAARRNALRALLVVLPIALLFLFMSGSASYAVVMLKTAAMGQQANTDSSSTMGRSLLESTCWGGVGALAGWLLLSAWPALLPYVLLTGLAGLLYGRRIFAGPAMHPRASMWSYAFLTMIIILAPAVLDDRGGGAGAAIWSRLGLFLLIALYGTVAVAVFNAFWPEKQFRSQ
jgi:hypothetical protein